MQSGGSAQLITTLITFFLIGIPIAIINSRIAKRKGKSSALYGWISVIPFVGYFVVFYLVSLTDAELATKIDKILSILAPSQTNMTRDEKSPHA